LEAVARRQETPRHQLLEEMQRRQNLVELHRRLRTLHPADIAVILESLPVQDRLVVWREVTPAAGAQALIEVDAGIRQSLLDNTPRQALTALLRELDADDLRYLADALPDDVVDEVSALLDASDRSWVEQSLTYGEGSAARLMTRDLLGLHDSQSVEDVIASIRQRAELPAQTDKLFVVDPRNVLVGAVSLGALITADAKVRLSNLMDRNIERFRPYDEASQVAKAFERYDLLSAPVVDDRGKLIGRVTAHAVMDFVRTASQNEALSFAGLRRAEDLFAPAIDSARNRWPWLAVNLATAFLASQVIGIFEGAIQQIVALAALLPIVASIGGNTGNQTVALVVRGLALDQITARSGWHLVRKELLVSVLNGAVWGTVVGVLATTVYRSIPLGAVLATAIVLNLVIAALVGVLIPLGFHRFDRDPAQGSSVVLTFVTDSMGFFLFLALARAFLL
jgi:magnesium transporter